MKSFCNLIIKIPILISFLYDSFFSLFYKRVMKNCGTNVRLRPSSSDYKGLENLSIGNNSSLPKNSVIYCTDAPIIIGDNVLFGPRPTLISGDHRIDKIGVPICSSFDKLPSNDKQIIIQDDVWCGANITILKGVIVGRGSVIASGAIMTKGCPPYSICAGVPAKVIGWRFSIEEVLEHEKKIYPQNDRFNKFQLCEQRAKIVL